VFQAVGADRDPAGRLEAALSGRWQYDWYFQSIAARECWGSGGRLRLWGSFSRIGSFGLGLLLGCSFHCGCGLFATG